MREPRRHPRRGWGSDQGCGYYAKRMRPLSDAHPKASPWLKRMPPESARIVVLGTSSGGAALEA